jgi:ubiquinone/menaquinone biosynthesis C-methylase UbiE
MVNRQTFFNQAAKNWDSHYYNAQLVAFLEQTVPLFDIKEGQNILDVGTGTGILIPFLLNAVGSNGHITGVDFAQNMVEICKAKYSQYPNVNIIVGNVENLQFPSETFDAITCFGLFPHLENKNKSLCEMNRMLKHNGRLIIAHALGSAEIKRHHQNASSVIAKDVLPAAEDMCKLLREAKFSEIQIFDTARSYVCLSAKL